MRLVLVASSVSILACLCGCENPSYSSMGMGKGQTMMMPTEIPSSNKLNEPVGKDKTDAPPVSAPDGTGASSPSETQTEGAPATEDKASESPDRAQL